MLSEAEIVKECKRYNPSAQKLLYSKYASVMKGVCIRYSRSIDDAKDILQEGFIKVFANIKSYKEDGPVEAWIRRIMVNTAISHYRKNSKHSFKDIDEVGDLYTDETEPETESELSYYNYTQEDLINCLNKIPVEYKHVFNLFYLEDTSHKEIAKLLSIEEKTSRTRLFRARKMLKEQLLKLKINKEELLEKR